MTKGSTQTTAEASHPTYRYWLWNDLEKNGYDVDFVGSWTAPNFPFDFDQDNEGHGGYMTGGILNGVAGDPRQGKRGLAREVPVRRGPPDARHERRAQQRPYGRERP